MKVIIAGGREFTDLSLMSKKMDTFLSQITEPITIVSGTARGADSTGELYAGHRGYEVIKMPANWDKHGKSAGYIRNEAMASVADACVVFWDGRSKGTGHMINLANNRKLLVRVIRY